MTPAVKAALEGEPAVDARAMPIDDETEEKNGSIHFMTLFNRQGKTRLAKW